jgi:hypothetical protein
MFSKIYLNQNKNASPNIDQFWLEHEIFNLFWLLVYQKMCEAPPPPSNFQKGHYCDYIGSDEPHNQPCDKPEMIVGDCVTCGKTGVQVNNSPKHIVIIAVHSLMYGKYITWVEGECKECSDNRWFDYVSGKWKHRHEIKYS